jgi:hypothetical protein
MQQPFLMHQLIFTAVMPANAGIHGALMQEAKMDARVRGHDGREGYVPCDEAHAWMYGLATLYQRNALAPSAHTDVRQRAP